MYAREHELETETTSCGMTPPATVSYHVLRKGNQECSFNVLEDGYAWVDMDGVEHWNRRVTTEEAREQYKALTRDGWARASSWVA